MSEKKVYWGVLGTASIAAGCVIPGMLLAENCKLYAIAGRNADKVEQFKEKYGFEVGYVGYEKLLEDPKVRAVYIPLPNHLHKEWTLKALRAGKHVLCEKPMALNAEEAREMYAVAAENGVILMEAYAYLHGEFCKALMQDIAQGCIGTPVYVDTAFVTQGYREDFRLHKEFGGGMLYDLGCYCTTMMLRILDAGKQYAASKGGTTFNGENRTEKDFSYAKCCAELTEEGVDAFSNGQILFNNGMRGSFTVGMILGKNSNARYDRLFIHGTEGSIRSEYAYNASGTLSYTIDCKGKKTVRMVSVSHNYRLETEQLGRCILSGEKPEVTPEFSVRNAELLDALLKEAGVC